MRSVTKSLANDSWREICLKKKKEENCYKEGLTNWDFLKKCGCKGEGRGKGGCSVCSFVSISF